VADAPALKDLAAWQIDMAIFDPTTTLGQVRASGAIPARRSRTGDFPARQTPEALRALQKAEIAKWWPIIKAAGIKAE
jgi:tripartite-type tricarboxylate transporter receptor subunit TctC